MAKKRAVKKASKKSSKPVAHINDVLRRLKETRTELGKMRSQLYRMEDEQKSQGKYYSKLFAAQETVISELCVGLKELRNLPEAVLMIATEAHKNQEKLEEMLGLLSEQFPLHAAAIQNPDSTAIIQAIGERIDRSLENWINRPILVTAAMERMEKQMKLLSDAVGAR